MDVGLSSAYASRSQERESGVRRRSRREGEAGKRLPSSKVALGCGESAEERLEKLQIATSLTPYRFQEQNRRREVFVDEGLVTEEARGAGVACGVSL